MVFTGSEIVGLINVDFVGRSECRVEGVVYIAEAAFLEPIKSTNAVEIVKNVINVDIIVGVDVFIIINVEIVIEPTTTTESTSTDTTQPTTESITESTTESTTESINTIKAPEATKNAGPKGVEVGEGEAILVEVLVCIIILVDVYICTRESTANKTSIRTTGAGTGAAEASALVIIDICVPVVVVINVGVGIPVFVEVAVEQAVWTDIGGPGLNTSEGKSEEGSESGLRELHYGWDVLSVENIVF